MTHLHEAPGSMDPDGHAMVTVALLDGLLDGRVGDLSKPVDQEVEPLPVFGQLSIVSNATVAHHLVAHHAAETLPLLCSQWALADEIHKTKEVGFLPRGKTTQELHLLRHDMRTMEGLALVHGGYLHPFVLSGQTGG